MRLCIALGILIFTYVAPAVPSVTGRVFAPQVKAIKLLVDHHEEILPSAVVPALQARCNARLS